MKSRIFNPIESKGIGGPGGRGWGGGAGSQLSTILGVRDSMDYFDNCFFLLNTGI